MHIKINKTSAYAVSLNSVFILIVLSDFIVYRTLYVFCCRMLEVCLLQISIVYIWVVNNFVLPCACPFCIIFSVMFSHMNKTYTVIIHVTR
jgi:hypothetical protein